MLWSAGSFCSSGRGLSSALSRSAYVADHAPCIRQALPGTLSLHEADLLEEGSFDEVLKVRSYTSSMLKSQILDRLRL